MAERNMFIPDLNLFSVKFYAQSDKKYLDPYINTPLYSVDHYLNSTEIPFKKACLKGFREKFVSNSNEF